MPSQDQKKAKTININLTEEEYEKVRALAQIRDLNPTAYTRLAALGNRIKPTVIEMPKEQITIDEHEEIEKLRAENQELKEQKKYDNERIEVLDRFIKYVNDKGYIDFKGYKEDFGLMQAMANYSDNQM
ncbi:plasmid mobilization protein, partial [Staphylococcus gallinarum]|uniref:plasmid mobilization protein n=1 Tax=Staphylococcus gallinarum TaxID=1293 RepID=UPI0021754CD2